MGVHYRFDYRIMVAMNEPAKTPPEDAESLQRFVADLMREKDAQITLRDEAITERDATIERLTRRAELLQDQLNLAIARRYSARSEKGPSPQMGLFDEAEVEAEREALEAQASSPRCGSQVPSKRRCATSPAPGRIPRPWSVRPNSVSVPYLSPWPSLCLR